MSGYLCLSSICKSASPNIPRKSTIQIRNSRSVLLKRLFAVGNLRLNLLSLVGMDQKELFARIVMTFPRMERVNAICIFNQFVPKIHNCQMGGRVAYWMVVCWFTINFRDIQFPCQQG